MRLAIVGLLAIGLLAFAQEATAQPASLTPAAATTQPTQIDQVTPGDADAEQQHNHKGDKDETGDWTDRTYRHAVGGWFSWDLKVSPDAPNELWVTYAGVDQRTFDLLIDGKMLSNQAQPGSDQDFYEHKYPLPIEMTQGKQVVTVRFQSQGEEYAGGVYGVRTMRVGEAVIAPTTAPSKSLPGKITASPKVSGQVVNPRAARDGREPRASNDNKPLSHFDWWPDNNRASGGKPVWVQLTFDAPTSVSQTDVYWWDDIASHGGCSVPTAWKALYQDGTEWKPVETTDTYGVEKDKYNGVHFKPVTTGAIRLEITLPERTSVGIQEWKVN